VKGRNYFNWFTDEEKHNWLGEFFHQYDGEDYTLIYEKFNSFMGRNFPNYYIFFFLSFDLKTSLKGESYWVKIYNKYKKYDNLNVKPGFSLISNITKPKIF
jgi:hypothetical protein